MTSISELAKRYRESGLNVLPCTVKEKRPVVDWKRFQNETFQGVFNTDAIGVVCGQISGNPDEMDVTALEIIDFDYKACSYQDWRDMVKSIDEHAFELIDSCVIESTQSGGKHVAYRYRWNVEETKRQNAEGFEIPFKDDKPDGNMKLTDIGIETFDSTSDTIEFQGKMLKRCADGEFVACTIETRGRGGFVVCAPSAGYNVESSNEWFNVPTLSQNTRNVFIEAALRLSRVKRKPQLKTEKVDYTKFVDTSKKYSGINVADYLRETDSTRRILEADGWTYCGEYDVECEKWRRPDKSFGCSALLHRNDGMFYCFTSSVAEFQNNTAYTPLQFYAARFFAGDVSQACKEMTQELRSNCQLSYETQYTSDFAAFEPVEEECHVVNVIDTEPEKSVIVDPSDIEISDAAFPDDGQIGKLMKLQRQMSVTKQPRFELAAALTGMSNLTARHILCTETCVSPCVYTLAVGLPGSGKDSGKRMLRHVFNRIGESTNSIHDSFSSIQAVQNAITANKKAFLLQDEFGAFLKAISKEKGGNVNLTRIVEEFLSLYSLYTSDRYTAVTTAEDNKNGTKTETNGAYYPALTIYGMTNPLDFKKSLTETFLNNGLSARFLFIFGDVDPPLLDAVNHRAEIDTDFLAELKKWQALRGVERTGCPVPYVVEAETDEARDMLKKHALDMRAIYSDAVHSGNLEKYQPFLNQLNRLNEKLRKYTCLYACSRVGCIEDKLKYSVEDVERGMALTDYEFRLFSYLCKNELAGSESEENLMKAKRWLLNRTNDRFTRTDFTKFFSRLERHTREDLLQTLSELEYIELEVINKSATDSGRGTGLKKLYHIKKENIR